MMNQENTNNTQAQATITLTEAVVELTQLLKEAISLAKEEEAASTTTTETTATTTTEATTATTETTTADAEFKGSMINNDPCDPIPAIGEVKNQVFVKELDKIADEANAEETVNKYLLDNITADISALYDIAEFALSHEGKNIDSDHSPYAPKDNRRGLIGDYQVFISKEITKDGDHIEGSFRLIIKDKSIVTPIMDFNIHLIDSRAKAFSSENTHRIEQMKEDHDLMRFLNIVEEISSVVMSKYISK